MQTNEVLQTAGFLGFGNKDANEDDGGSDPFTLQGSTECASNHTVLNTCTILTLPIKLVWLYKQCSKFKGGARFSEVQSPPRKEPSHSSNTSCKVHWFSMYLPVIHWPHATSGSIALFKAVLHALSEDYLFVWGRDWRQLYCA